MTRDEALSVLREAARLYADYLEDMDDSHADEVERIDQALNATEGS